MICYKYHVRTAGVLVRRDDEAVVIKDGEMSHKPPKGYGFEKGFQHNIKLTDGWVGVEWGDREQILWEWFKQHGSEVSMEEAGPTPLPLIFPDPEMVKASIEAHARGDSLTTEEYLEEIKYRGTKEQGGEAGE